MTLTSDQHRALRELEYRARDFGRAHIKAARVLYDAEQWPQACFLGMTAIEELGKSLEVQRVRAENEAELFETLADWLREHGEKALMGAFPALVMNDGARDRHGRHPETGIYRVEAVRLLAAARTHWMVLRNRCLYADLGRDVEHVGREHAYLMIVVALEVLARQVSPGFRYPGIAEHETGDDEMERRVRADLAAFMDQERGLVDLDRIDFLADPERYDAINKAAGQRLFGGRTADRRRRHRRRSR